MRGNRQGLRVYTDFGARLNKGACDTMAQLEYDIKSVAELRETIERTAASWELAPGTTLEETHCGDVPCVWISADTETPVTDAVYLHIHGGGYYRGSARVDGAVCSFLCASTGVRCLSINYRRPPDEGVFPAAIDDVYAVWKWLIDPSGGNVSPGRIVVGGTSAGGGLCFALLLKIRDEGGESPAGAVPISPWTDMTHSGESFTTNAQYGPSREYLEHWSKVYLDGADPRTPYASPIYGDLAGLPPMLIQVGGNETMLDDASGFAAKAARAGCQVALEVYAGQGHSFQHQVATSAVAREAVDHVAAFVRKEIEKKL